MARITCAISGIKFDCSYLESINIPHTAGYFHPIFALPHTSLHHLYSRHCRGQLTSNDSYLLFMAFLHSSEQVEWKHPVTLNPNDTSTKKLIENNLAQLIRVLERTNCIAIPSFTQPSFRVTYENCKLEQIHNWIAAWEENIEDFQKGRIDIRVMEALQKVENRLTYLILSGEKPENFSHIIANWACQAAEFPPAKAEEWKKIIRSCFNTTKMFNTPLASLKEVKEYCECNIEVGSIHFHTLSEVLKEGIFRHIDYLGGSSLALGYTLLPAENRNKEEEIKNAAQIEKIRNNAPDKEPKQEDYNTSLEFLKARLAYRIVVRNTRN